jgi:type II secretory pathway component PulF
MPLTQGLRHLVEHTSDRMLLRAVRDLEASVLAGRPMSEAMARHPRAFSPGQIGYVRAGESGGFLKEALSELAVQSEADWSAEAATKYNPILVLVRWFLFPFLAGWMVFMGGIASVGEPGALSASLARAILAAAFTGLVLVSGWPLLERLHRQTPLGRITESVLLQLPVAGARFRRADRIRAGAALAHALNAGVPTSIAWDLAADAPDSHDYHWRMVEQAWRIREGRPVSEAMAASGIFGPGMVQAARSGEETGDLPAMLEQTLRFDREEARLIANLTPWVIAFIGYMLYIVVGALLVLGSQGAF